jgi:pimeloyl-ACP methyl ester carboxylesterase
MPEVGYCLGEPMPHVADDVRAMIRGEDGPVLVVGASLGGLAAIAARRTAEDVAGLVLVDVVPDPDPARVRPWLDGRGLIRSRRNLVRSDRKSIASHQVTSGCRACQQSLTGS